MGADAVFISYSHDSPEHQERVLQFSNSLRAAGVDAELDQYHTRPPQGWPRWCEECLRRENAKHVLMICTPNYRNRVENKVSYNEGWGVYWEGALIYQYIYDEKVNERFIPVLLGDESDESIPIRLRGFARYHVKACDLSDPGFEALYRELTLQPVIIKPALGAKVVLGTKAAAAPAPLPLKQALTTFESEWIGPRKKAVVDIYRRKLSYLQEQLAIASDAGVKFTLQMQIEEARAKLVEHGELRDDR